MRFGGIFEVSYLREAMHEYDLSTNFCSPCHYPAHGILSPLEEERLQLMEKMNARDSELMYQGSLSSDEDLEQVFVDECEILDWDYSAPELKNSGHDSEKYVQESSHKLIEMADDNQTPLRIRDGNFGRFHCFDVCLLFHRKTCS